MMYIAPTSGKNRGRVCGLTTVVFDVLEPYRSKLH